jgi:hypothetical protein
MLLCYDNRPDEDVLIGLTSILKEAQNAPERRYYETVSCYVCSLVDKEIPQDYISYYY